MSKKAKLGVFIVILFIGVGSIVFNLSSNINDSVYVVSESEEIKKEAVAENTNYNENRSDSKDSKTIFVSGEVNNPGVVTVEADKRLSDAIDELGGVTQDADLNRVNLAMKVEDEKHYIIPKKGEETSSIVEEKENVKIKDSKININIASVEELDNLPGVGEATANKIINYRDENGTFNSIEEIKNVNGIGDKKYIELKDKITVK